ncbi:MAG: winged helix-turn-helix transcriptional regulator [Chloroflexi bacterium]|nr:winged helix-turn-helix transcriptional regulator [Chloroflexota bacterium]
MIPVSIFELQAELLRTLGNAARLEIMHSLRDGPRRVGDIVQVTGLPPSTVSRHLAVLRGGGLVVVQRQGKDQAYHITDLKIISICDLMREVLAEQAAHNLALIQPSAVDD